jgi:hypothetical protein
MTVATHRSSSRHAKGDVLGSLVGASVGALLVGRPELSPKDIFAALFAAAADQGTVVKAKAPASPPPQGRQTRPPVGAAKPPKPAPKRATACGGCAEKRPVKAGCKSCVLCLKRRAASRRKWRAARRARVASIDKARTKAAQRKAAEPARTKPPAATKVRKPARKGFRHTFDGSDKRIVFEALDRANDGLVTRALELLDDASPVLLELSRSADRPKGRPFRTWREAINFVTLTGSCWWRDVSAERLKLVSDAMLAALTAGGGGVDELSRAGIAWPGLRLPNETEAALEHEREKLREAEVFFDERAREAG